MNSNGGSQISRKLLYLCSLFIASGSEAAEQGSIGASSSGSISISISIAPQATISGLGDIDLRNASTDRLSRTLCLSSNSLVRSYTITAIGGGQAGLFELSNGTQGIGYDVHWASRDKGQPSKTANPVIQLEAASSDADCKLGLGSAELIVGMGPADRYKVQANARLSGALTLIIAPN